MKSICCSYLFTLFEYLRAADCIRLYFFCPLHALAASNLHIPSIPREVLAAFCLYSFRPLHALATSNLHISSVPRGPLTASILHIPSTPAGRWQHLFCTFLRFPAGCWLHPFYVFFCHFLEASCTCLCTSPYNPQASRTDNPGSRCRLQAPCSDSIPGTGIPCKVSIYAPICLRNSKGLQAVYPI